MKKFNVGMFFNIVKIYCQNYFDYLLSSDLINSNLHPKNDNFGIKIAAAIDLIPIKLIGFGYQSDFVRVRPIMKKHDVWIYRLLTGCFLTILLPCLFPGMTDVQAGKTYYYDAGGNRISEEEYRKIVEQMSKQDEEPSVNNEEKVGSSKASGPTEADNQTDDAADNEAEDIEALYRVEVSSETIFRAFERNTDKNTRDEDKKGDTLVVPGYQYLRLDLGALEQEGLSLHMFGWRRYDFNDSSFFEDNPDGQLLYGYLEYKRPQNGLNLTLGRQHIMAGIINNSIDGLGIKSALTPYFKLALYGGSPAELSSQNGRGGDSIWGGRVAGHRGSDYEIGLSYKNIRSDGENDEEKGAIDIFAGLPYDSSFSGFSSYNFDSRGWGEHSYEIRFHISDFSFRPFFQRFRYEDFFNTNDNSANPFRFLADTGEILAALGSDIVWQRFNQIDIGSKVNFYDYDKRDDNALYFEGNANWHLNEQTQIGGQFGRMNGDTDETRYLLTRAFFYGQLPFVFARAAFLTGDIIYVHYDEEIFGENSSFWVSLGCGWRFLKDSLQLKLSGDWSNDPFFDSNLRGLFKLQFDY